MSNEKFEQTLQDKIQTLPKEMQPEKDLWQGIDIALASAERETSAPESGAKVTTLSSWSGGKPMALAASILLVAVLGWQGIQKSAHTDAPSSLVSLMMAQHDEQKTVLLASLSDSAELTDNWKTQLNELEQAENAIEAALRDDPDNMALLKMLQQVHQQQLDLIERVHAPLWQEI